MGAWQREKWKVFVLLLRHIQSHTWAFPWSPYVVGHGSASDLPFPPGWTDCLTCGQKEPESSMLLTKINKTTTDYLSFTQVVMDRLPLTLNRGQKATLCALSSLKYFPGSEPCLKVTPSDSNLWQAAAKVLFLSSRVSNAFSPMGRTFKKGLFLFKSPIMR